jgi:hypothetical protein
LLLASAVALWWRLCRPLRWAWSCPASRTCWQSCVSLLGLWLCALWEAVGSGGGCMVECLEVEALFLMLMDGSCKKGWRGLAVMHATEEPRTDETLPSFSFIWISSEEIVKDFRNVLT